jgi:hypothetical protein
VRRRARPNRQNLVKKEISIELIDDVAGHAAYPDSIHELFRGFAPMLALQTYAVSTRDRTVRPSPAPMPISCP